MNSQLTDWNFKLCLIKMCLICIIFPYIVLGKSKIGFRVKKGILQLSILKRALNCKSTVYISSNSFQEKISKLPGKKA